MSDYQLSTITPRDQRAMRQLCALLEQEGLQLDQNLDHTVGLFDEDYRLVATGSCFGNTLRCMAVDSAHQGEGLMNQVVSALVNYEYERGIVDLFLYTKCDKADIFGDMGFYEVARVEGRVVFMENRKNGFSNYLAQLLKESAQAGAAGTRQGAVIMNANPFTLGHRYLLQTASAACDLLHVFVVSEEASLVPFAVRERLVKEGAADLANVVFHRTGNYMVSNATFPSYFLKDGDLVIESHASLDIAVFIRIAKALGITDRFVGEEPTSHVTGIYNAVMRAGLAQAGIGCTVLPRLSGAGAPISASTVRQCLKDGDFAALSALVPASTLAYFTSAEAAPVLDRLRSADQVAHY